MVRFVLVGDNVALGFYRTMQEAIDSLYLTPGCNPQPSNSNANSAHYAEFFGYDGQGKCVIYTITEVRGSAGPGRVF